MADGFIAADDEHGSSTLTEGDFFAAEDPFALFAAWLQAATLSEPNDPTAMALATVDESGVPDVRMVLLKGFDHDGFVFYTNLESRKGGELATTPKAALCFHWKSLRRQVRVRGAVTMVAPGEADEYYLSRPQFSRIGAWASQQSRPLESRAVLETAMAKYTAQFAEGVVPRPPHWSGFRVAPQEIEFWRDGAFRLHDRLRFSREGGQGWTKTRLFP